MSLEHKEAPEHTEQGVRMALSQCLMAGQGVSVPLSTRLLLPFSLDSACPALQRAPGSHSQGSALCASCAPLAFLQCWRWQLAFAPWNTMGIWLFHRLWKFLVFHLPGTNKKSLLESSKNTFNSVLHLQSKSHHTSNFNCRLNHFHPTALKSGLFCYVGKYNAFFLSWICPAKLLSLGALGCKNNIQPRMICTVSFITVSKIET